MSNPAYRGGGNRNRRGGSRTEGSGNRNDTSQGGGNTQTAGGRGNFDRGNSGRGGGGGEGKDGTAPRGPRDGGSNNRGKSTGNDRGGIGKRGANSRGRGERGNRGDRGGRGGGGTSGTDRDGDVKMGAHQLEKIQAAINEGSDVNILEPKDVKMGGITAEGYKPGHVPITVSGWTSSKASNNPDGGVSALTTWLGKKASESKGANINLRKPERDGDDLVFWVYESQAPRILHLNGYTWAGAQLTIQEGGGARVDSQPRTQQAQETKLQIEQFLNSRYIEGEHYLNLTAIQNDEAIKKMGLTEIMSDTAKSKFFPALMKVCDLHFDNVEKKRKAIVSVSLANNGLTSIAPVTTLSQTLPDLKNLDLSNNQIPDVKALLPWRWKFRHLDHLIITGNPIESTDFVPTLLKWFPKLRLINQQVVRSATELAAPVTNLPIAILAADFRDEAQIAETFLKDFFKAFDTDRTGLANQYYDAQSVFSLSVNTSAPRASDAEVRGQGWDPYIKHSRNLLKITHLPARMSRAYTGVGAISEIWAALPKTKHPDLLIEFAKWNIECHSIPGLPDLKNPAAGGVGGLVITVHGQFEEFIAHNQHNATHRSFDRTFVLGPGVAPGSVRVVSDIVCLRAWGGFEAWLPNPDGSTAAVHPEAANGIAVPELSKSTEQLMMEKMVLEISQKTNLNLQYARLCLESAQWNPDRALVAFAATKDSLGPEAWL